MPFRKYFGIPFGSLDPRKQVNYQAPIDQVFRQIHDKNVWKDADSRSGPGSTLAATASLRTRLPPLLSSLGVRTMLDAPCGDFHWLRAVDLPVERYIGADIVPGLIEANQTAYANAHRQFMVLDLTTDALPTCDVVFCRDCLMHLSYAMIERALKNILASSARWLLTTTFLGGQNKDIGTGHFFRIDLLAPPFSFPQPMQLIDDCWGSKNANHWLGLWQIEELRAHLNRHRAA